MSERSYDFEIVVVGAGPAGLAAACAAAESGAKVGVVDDTPWIGGQIWRGQQEHATDSKAHRWFQRFHKSGSKLLPQTSIVACPGKNILLAEQTQGPCEIRWQRLVLATGAREFFLPYPGWTLPGVIGPGGLQALVKHGWPIKGQRVVVAGSGPLLLAVAGGLHEHGAVVVAVSEQAPWQQVCRFGLGLLAYPDKLWQGAVLKLRLAGVPYRFGVWPSSVEGEQQVRRVNLTNGSRTWSEECDLLACAFGLVPNTELASALGCELQDGFVRVDRNQATSVTNVYCAGEPSGIGGADCALVEGQIAGYAAASRQVQAGSLLDQRQKWHKFRVALAQGFALRNELKTLATPETLVCRCEDVQLGKLRQFGNWRDAKLQARCGMGPCQGRICGPATRFVLGWGMESVRPPIMPVRVRSLISPSKSATKQPIAHET